jgi:hypothetical protein
MFRHTAFFGLLATLAVFGCSGADRQEPTRPPALAYTGTLGSSAKQAAVAPPVPERAGPPRLVRQPGGNSQPAASAVAPDEVRKGRGLAIGGGPPPTLEPSSSIPSPPATLDLPPRAGVDAALRAVPHGVPVGRLNRATLEAPIRDRSRFERCRIPAMTRVQIDAVVYNGKAVGVDVRTTPSNPALDFCIEQVVRETSWVSELAVNRVSSTL